MSMILGYGGVIELSREWPELTVFPTSSTKATAAENYILSREPGFWTGQRVWMHCERGVPVKPPSSAWAPCPDGYRFWGDTDTTKVAGPFTTHRGTGDGAFWRLSDSGKFWEDHSTVGLIKTIAAYIHRDPLDRLSFYASELGAINKNGNELLHLFSVDYAALLLAGYANQSQYTTAVAEVGLDSFLAKPTAETKASNLTDIPLIVNEIASDPETRGWYALVACKDWALQTEPTLLDTTAIGDEFGDNVKDVVRGAGSFNAFIPISQAKAGQIDSRGLIRLMLMTEIGARARARFRIQDQNRSSCDSEDSLWLECDILLGAGEISMDTEQAVPYSAQFVVVKDKDGKGITPKIGYFNEPL
jgi:hypothetical protein